MQITAFKSPFTGELFEDATKFQAHMQKHSERESLRQSLQAGLEQALQQLHQSATVQELTQHLKSFLANAIYLDALPRHRRKTPLKDPTVGLEVQLAHCKVLSAFEARGRLPLGCISLVLQCNLYIHLDSAPSAHLSETLDRLKFLHRGGGGGDVNEATGRYSYKVLALFILEQLPRLEEAARGYEQLQNKLQGQAGEACRLADAACYADPQAEALREQTRRLELELEAVRAQQQALLEEHRKRVRAAMDFSAQATLDHLGQALGLPEVSF